MLKINRRQILTASSLLCIPYTVGASEPYPSKAIRLTTPNSAGSGADGMTRRLADYLGRSLKQSVYVENIPGAGGVLGSEALLRSKPDGYTLGLISSNYLVFPHLYKKLSFDAIKDMTPIGGVASSPMVLVARADLPAQNVGELKALAIKNSGKLNLGSSGNGTILHLMGMYMQEHGQFTLTHVPYKGVAPVIPDLVSGVIDVAFFSYASVEGLVKQGRLKVLAISSTKRLASLPNVPTISETFPGCVLDAWYAVIAPKGVPTEIVQTLNAAITTIVQSDAFKTQIAAEGAVPSPMKPDALLEFMKTEFNTLGSLVSKSGAVIQ